MLLLQRITNVRKLENNIVILYTNVYRLYNSALSTSSHRGLYNQQKIIIARYSLKTTIFYKYWYRYYVVILKCINYLIIR